MVSKNENEVLTSETRNVKIGVISRIDYGGIYFRKGLLEIAKGVFQEENVNFVILAGGLIDYRYLSNARRILNRKIRLKKKEIKNLEKSSGDPKEINRLNGKLKDYYDRLKKLSPEEIVKRFANIIPEFTNKHGEKLSLYIFPSPAFDGDTVDEDFSEKLHELRPDIRVYRSGGDIMPLIQVEKKIGVLTPKKAVWMRGDYYSTPIDRLIKDMMNQSSRELADFYVVGGFGSFFFKPKGESVFPYVSVPALNNIGSVRVNENQIGALVVEIHKNMENPIVKNFSFKDLVMNERSFIKPPKGLSDKSMEIIGVIEKEGKSGLRILASKTGMTENEIVKEIEAIQKKKRTKKWPGIMFYPWSNQYGFDYRRVMENLHYSPVIENIQIDSIVAYGCLHAGCVHTTYGFFLEEIPRVLLKTGATILVGAGDFVEGLKHDLILKEEVFGGLNITAQEKIAGTMIAEVTTKVFKARFEIEIEKCRASNINVDDDKLREIVSRSLITNVIIPGNHDLWSQDLGHDPLYAMKTTAKERIAKSVTEVLGENGFHTQNIFSAVSEKIIELEDDGNFILPSGLKMTILHPHMARTKTRSLRIQEMIAKADEDSNVIIGANFHVSGLLDVWTAKGGQKSGSMIGTMKMGSKFEDHKLKTVDHGFEYLRICSQNGRIVITESTFYSGNKETKLELDQKNVLGCVLKKIKS